jgi:hypothetical protein
MKVTRAQIILVLAVVVFTALGAYLQKPGSPPPGGQKPPPGGGGQWNPPPQREIPPMDTVLIRESLDKLNKAIEGKQDSPAVNVFQNVKIHQKMPAGRFLGMMGAWTRTFGVDCAYCHVVGQWEKDDKNPKLTARAMDKFQDDVNDMVENIKSITDEHAGVYCWTCHRGSPIPEKSPRRPGGGPPPPKKGN